MRTRKITAPDSHDLKSKYSQAVEVTDAKRTLYVSGQIPVSPEDKVPEDFLDQARQAWANVEAQLRAADMGLDNIVKHTTFLADRAYRAENSRVRREILGEREPALTVIVCDIYDEEWLLEIEAIAVA
ncbi:RidA family protein [Tateyamaria sp. ANG-S1]|uniref:RidA family protein n=1 Tax=Tateyamaria sp. ANG-S1 TaxID=1577905 RepID=UPI0005808225|nr:RidA family protein [Tateyamaria sp. ANG-S1]KIC51799.1 endoribonuclease L-PSP [Tateyamaria sp. ANG-S1]